MNNSNYNVSPFCVSESTPNPTLLFIYYYYYYYSEKKDFHFIKKWKITQHLEKQRTRGKVDILPSMLQKSQYSQQKLSKYELAYFLVFPHVMLGRFENHAIQSKVPGLQQRQRLEHPWGSPQHGKQQWNQFQKSHLLFGG